MKRGSGGSLLDQQGSVDPAVKLPVLGVEGVHVNTAVVIVDRIGGVVHRQLGNLPTDPLFRPLHLPR